MAEATYNHVFSLNSHKAIRSSNIPFKVWKSHLKIKPAIDVILALPISFYINFASK